MDDLLSRGAEPQTQELDARIVPLLLAGVPAAIMAGGLTAVTVARNKDQPKREISDDLLSRKAQDWGKWPESVRTHAPKREPSHV